MIVFDQATKLAYCVAWVHLDAHGGDQRAAYLAGKRALTAMTERIRPSRTPNLPLGKVGGCGCCVWKLVWWCNACGCDDKYIGARAWVF